MRICCTSLAALYHGFVGVVGYVAGWKKEVKKLPIQVDKEAQQDLELPLNTLYNKFLYVDNSVAFVKNCQSIKAAWQFLENFRLLEKNLKNITVSADSDQTIARNKKINSLFRQIINDLNSLNSSTFCIKYEQSNQELLDLLNHLKAQQYPYDKKIHELKNEIEQTKKEMIVRLARCLSLVHGIFLQRTKENGIDGYNRGIFREPGNREKIQSLVRSFQNGIIIESDLNQSDSLALSSFIKQILQGNKIILLNNKYNDTSLQEKDISRLKGEIKNLGPHEQTIFRTIAAIIKEINAHWPNALKAKDPICSLNSAFAGALPSILRMSLVNIRFLIAHYDKIFT